MRTKEVSSNIKPNVKQSKLTKIHKDFLKQVKFDFDSEFIPPRSYDLKNQKVKITEISLTNKGIIVKFNDSLQSLVKVKQFK